MAGAWSFCAGAAAGALVRPPWSVAVVGVVCGLGLLGARRSVPAFVAVAALGFGSAGLSSSMSDGDGAIAALATQVPRCEIRARVLERAGGLGTLLGVRSLGCGDAVLTGDVGKVIADPSPGEPGGEVVVSGRVVPLGRDGFSDARSALGAEAEFAIGEVVHIVPPSTVWLRAAARLRVGVGDAGRALEPERAALLSGLTIGDTAGLDAETERRLRRSGLSHLVAVSGSNVAIVVGAAMLAMRRAGKFAGVVAGAATLLVYVMTVGPEPSVLRAAAMGGIALLALSSGHRVAPLVALGLALGAVLVVRPHMVSSVGLQLSAAATAGLILWSARLAGRLSFLPRPVALTAAATLAAQAAVAPLLLLSFGELSLIAPVANLLALPAVPVATIVGLGAGSVATVSPELGGLLARVCEPAVAWILWVGDSLGSLPAAAVTLPGWVGLVLAVPVVIAARRALRAPDIRGPRRLET